MILSHRCLENKQQQQQVSPISPRLSLTLFHLTPLPPHNTCVPSDFTAFEIDKGAASSSDIISSTPKFEHAGGTMSETTNNVLVIPKKPEEIRPFKCEVCNITCNTEDLLEKHKQGKKHLKLVDSSANLPKKVTPAVASETLLGEVVNKQQGLLQHGARTDSIFCHLCNVVCYNQEIFQKHVVGKKHSAKAIIQLASQSGFFVATSYPSGGSQKKPPTFQCGLCKITCTSNELLKMHIAGKKHLNKLKESGQIPNLPLTPMVNPEASTDEGETVNSDGSNRNAKRAGSHADVETKKQKVLQGGAALDAIRTCDLCNVVCNSPTVYNAHLEGQKHAAAIAMKHAETGQQS